MACQPSENVDIGMSNVDHVMPSLGKCRPWHPRKMSTLACQNVDHGMPMTCQASQNVDIGMSNVDHGMPTTCQASQNVDHGMPMTCQASQNVDHGMPMTCQ
ncbi:unnamed protein product [Malus baccata var. baccata]